MPNTKKEFNPRDYMVLAIEEMKKSISENRKDGKESPKVGAVLVSPEGKVLGTAFRGEMRAGDHAEYSLLDRKFRDITLTGNYLFATLEPCAPGSRNHPKLGCSERIVNARISKVWVGIEDPDPTVDRKGIQFLINSGIEVEMFDKDLQEVIYNENKDFIKQAKERAIEVKKIKEIELTPLEKPIIDGSLDEFSQEALELYIQRRGLNMRSDSPEFLSILKEQQLIERTEENRYIPTGLGILLFGKNTRNRYPQAVLKAEVRHDDGEPEIQDFNTALTLIPDRVEEWIRKVIPSKISRDSFARKTTYDYPIEVLREAIINALVHRDYDIAGAKSYLIIEPDKIIIKSPGLPVNPIKFEDFQHFKAPSLSRNPKLMAVFNEMKYVEERGIGMDEMKSLPDKYRLPQPTIIWEEPYLIITFIRTNKNLLQGINTEEFNDEEIQGLLFIEQEKEISRIQYAEHFDFNDKKAQRHLYKFAASGAVEKIGKGRATKYKYIIPRSPKKKNRNK